MPRSAPHTLAALFIHPESTHTGSKVNRRAAPYRFSPIFLSSSPPAKNTRFIRPINMEDHSLECRPGPVRAPTRKSLQTNSMATANLVIMAVRLFHLGALKYSGEIVSTLS